MEVIKTNAHIYANIIDDTVGHTLVSALPYRKILRICLLKETKKQQPLLAKLWQEKALDKGMKKLSLTEADIFITEEHKLWQKPLEAGLKF